jgi:hypothetical protein
MNIDTAMGGQKAKMILNFRSSESHSENQRKSNKSSKPKSSEDENVGPFPKFRNP